MLIQELQQNGKHMKNAHYCVPRTARPSILDIQT